MKFEEVISFLNNGKYIIKEEWLYWSNVETIKCLFVRDFGDGDYQYIMKVRISTRGNDTEKWFDKVWPWQPSLEELYDSDWSVKN